MFTLGIEPRVFKTNVGPEQTLRHDPVFKYDVTGLNNRDFVQYQIMLLNNELKWSVLDCVGNIIMTSFETPQQALLKLEARLNKEYGFTTTTIN